MTGPGGGLRATAARVATDRSYPLNAASLGGGGAGSRCGCLPQIAPALSARIDFADRRLARGGAGLDHGGGRRADQLSAGLQCARVTT